MTLNIYQLMNDTENMLHLQNGILVSCKNEIYRKVDETEKYTK